MQLNQKQIEKLLESSMPSIVEGFKRQIINSISLDVSTQAGQDIAKFVREWVQVNILPEIEKSLVENKEGLVAVGILFAERSVETIAEAMVASLKENLSQSWTRTEIFKSLFK
jgi:hypothetical protein